MICTPILTATVTPNGNLKLTANNAARAWLKEQVLDGKRDLDILWDGLEGYWNNGSFEPFDAGDANPFVGISSAPCIAESMDVDDDGTKSISGRFWHHRNYMIESFADQLKNRGFVYFHAT